MKIFIGIALHMIIYEQSIQVVFKICQIHSSGYQFQNIKNDFYRVDDL